MPYRDIKSKECSRGSITVEASISMVIFTFAIVSMLSIINICRLQSHIGNALNRTALEISQYSYFYYASGLYSAESSVKGSVPGDGLYPEKVLDTKDLVRYAASLLSFGSNDNALSGSLSGSAQKLLGAGISQGMEAVESALIAAPITKLMFQDNLGCSGEEADTFLRSMGIPDGLNGLDFSLSSFFPAEAPCDICLAVCYRVRIPFFGGVSVTVLQRSETGAWLGGDESKYNLFDAANNGGKSGNISGTSIWKMTAFERGLRFKEIFSNSHPSSSDVEGMRGVICYDAAARTYYNCVSINTFSESYNSGGNTGGFNEAAACEHTLRKVKVTAAEVFEHSEEGISSSIEYTVFIPEDAADAVAARIREYLEGKSASIEKEYPSVNLVFRIEKAGGKANE